MATLDVQPGDKVILNTRKGESIGEVERLTKLYIIVDGTKYSKGSGHAAGDDPWNVRWIETATDEQIEHLRMKNRSHNAALYIKKFDYSTLSPESVVAVYRELKKQMEVSEKC